MAGQARQVPNRLIERWHGIAGWQQRTREVAGQVAQKHSSVGTDRGLLIHLRCKRNEKTSYSKASPGEGTNSISVAA